MGAGPHPPLAKHFVVDSVAYGPVVANHNFLESGAAPLPPAGQVIARVPDGADSNNGAVDFQVTGSTPKQ